MSSPDGVICWRISIYKRKITVKKGETYNNNNKWKGLLLLLGITGLALLLLHHGSSVVSHPVMQQ
jgi:hypothetical protein